MAIKANITTEFGEQRSCYIRLNNVEVSNHGIAAHAVFRGFLSRDTYEAGAACVWERRVEFPADVSAPLWPQAYAAMVAQEALAADEV